LASEANWKIDAVAKCDGSEIAHAVGKMIMDSNKKRLIEVDFPLEQVSLDSVHEKNVRHGHISTLHIWPARRPLAASRAALIGTLLPDPGNAQERRAIYRRLAGEVIETIEQKKVGGRVVEKTKRETRGGILHWGRESGPDLDWFRKKIRDAYGGHPPKVLDPFAGGGAIPLEAMRLGCDVTAIDLNPVAWLILKCTLEYPQKLRGQTRPLPAFALQDQDFMEALLKAKGLKGAALKRQVSNLVTGGNGVDVEPALFNHESFLKADLAWQVRAWGRWVLAEARKQLGHRYPTYAEFQPLKPNDRTFGARPLQLLKLDADGKSNVTQLNAGFDAVYLKDPRNPRWVMKPTVAYLWARTVRCKGCRATIPLLKTRWLAKKDKKRVVLTFTLNAERTGVFFFVETNVPQVGGNAAQRREHDKRKGAGTMTRSGAQCPCCPTIMTAEDIRLEGQAGRLGMVMTGVVVDGPDGKEYRAPTPHELTTATIADADIKAVYADIPFGVPTEAIPVGGSRSGGGSPFTTPLFGLDQWAKLFTDRQLLALGVLTSIVRSLANKIDKSSADKIDKFSADWFEALIAFLAVTNDRIADRSSTIAHWDVGYEKVANTFTGFRLPISWDFCETSILSDTTGSYSGQLEWVARCIEHAQKSTTDGSRSHCHQESAMQLDGEYDVIITDPPYYDAIPYSDLMDFFYVWLRRVTRGLSREIDASFCEPLGPKWNHTTNDGELIDDASRFGGNRVHSTKAYEDGMARVFRACYEALRPDGRLVVVFANKQPSAWETLVAALIRSGFVVDGSWPIQTEMGNRTRAMASAALASSVWLVCKKRPTVRPGWDTSVISEMRERIHTQLRTFWDAGIRGPDFVWAATGPALEAFSKYPVVKKADQANTQMTVSEFLREVRRLVVDFVVGRVLTHGDATEMAASLDDVTTYYLLHRNDFGIDDAPIGACILYALSCNLSDNELADRFDILSRTGGTLFDDVEESEDREDDEDVDGVDGGSGGKGNKVRLKAWNQRKGKTLGYEMPGGHPVPLIDQAHRLMHLWRAGDEAKVDEYLDTRGLKRNALFAQLLQALIELAPANSEERSILESVSNHIAARGGISAPRQIGMEV
jgi:putative DNA methylase